MAQVIYALLAGINDYQGRVNSLSGCADDIRGFQDFLEGRVDSERIHVHHLTLAGDFIDELRCLALVV